MSHPNRAAYGQAAIQAGSTSRGEDDKPRQLADTLANLMHLADREGVDFATAVERAERNARDECDLDHAPTPPIVIVTRHPDSENHIDVFPGVGDVHVFDVDLGRSFDGTCDDEHQYAEWSESLLSSWDLPRGGPAYEAYLGAIECAQP